MLDQNIPVITDLDAARIRELGARMPGRGSGPDPLAELIEMVTEQAEIVPSRGIAADVITVNSTVSFRDELTGSVHRVTLAYPHEASIAERRISILSPVGRALLGLAVGGVAAFESPDGSARQLRILELHFQPEAAGEFTL